MEPLVDQRVALTAVVRERVVMREVAAMRVAPAVVALAVATVVGQGDS